MHYWNENMQTLIAIQQIAYTDFCSINFDFFKKHFEEA